MSASAGTHLVLLGASGSGKSTLLRLVGQLLQPQTGSIHVVGNVSFTQQDPAVQLVGSTVIEDVMFGPLNQQASASEALQRSKNALEAVGAAHLADRQIAALSTGELQLVALAGALASEPDVLLLDEPTAYLDTTYRAVLASLIKRVCLAGTVVVEATHSLRASRQASQVVLLNKGRVAAMDTPANILCNRELLQSTGVLAAARKRIGINLRSKTSTGNVLARLTQPLVPSDILMQPGTCTVVTGSTGSGKSTLALALLGLTPAGLTLAKPLPGALLHAKQLRIIFQQPERYFWGDTISNELNATPHVCVSLLDQLGLPSEFAERKLAALSEGEARRAALAIAMADQPDLLVVDEPFAGLDQPARLRVKEMLSGYMQAGGCLLLVATERRHLRQLATQCIVMSNSVVHAVTSSGQQSQSWAECLDPRTKLLILIAVLTTLFATSPVGTACMFAWAMLAWRTSGGKSNVVLAPHSVMMLAAVTVLAHAVWGPAPYIEPMAWLRVSRLGIARGGLLAVRLITMAIAANTLTATASPLALSRALQWLLSPLWKAGIKMPDLPMLLAIGVRFVPEIQADARRLMMLRRLVSTDKGIKRLAKLTQTSRTALIPLLRMALRRASALGDALALRWYRPGRMALLPRYTLAKRDLIAWAFTMIFMAAAWLLNR